MPTTSALRKMARASLAAVPRRAAAVADDLHHGHAERVAEGGVEGDDCEVRLERLGPVGAFGDRQAEQHAVGEQAGEADGDAVLPGAAEEEPRAEEPGEKARRRADVEAAQQRPVEPRREVEPGDPGEEQAGDREVLGELHQPVDARVGEGLEPDGEIARPDHEEDRQDDVDQRLHVSRRR
jgi:hypothetical protein